eukprot:1601194-Rhodomonas_salina.1
MQETAYLESELLTLRHVTQRNHARCPALTHDKGRLVTSAVTWLLSPHEPCPPAAKSKAKLPPSWYKRNGACGCSCLPKFAVSRPNPNTRTAFSVQFVPVMRFLAFDFG